MADAVGEVRGDPVAYGLLDGVGVLARDEAEGELQLGGGRDDGFAAGALVAGGDAVDLGGGAGPDAFQGGVAGFAEGGVGVGGAQPGGFVEGELGEEGAFLVGEGVTPS